MVVILFYMAFRRSVAVRWLSPPCGISHRAPASLLAALPWGIVPAPSPSAPFSLSSVAQQGHGFGVRIPQGRPPLARSFLASVPPMGGLVYWVLCYQGKRWASPNPHPPWGEGTGATEVRARGGGFRSQDVGRRLSAGWVRWLVRRLAAISPKFGVRWAGCRVPWFGCLFLGWLLLVQNSAFGGQVAWGRVRWLGSFGGCY